MKKLLLGALCLLPSICCSEITWEPVGKTPFATTFNGGSVSNIYRARVPHGWFIMVNQYNRDQQFVSPSSITFYPDEQHQWEVETDSE